MAGHVTVRAAYTPALGDSIPFARIPLTIVPGGEMMQPYSVELGVKTFAQTSKKLKHPPHMRRHGACLTLQRQTKGNLGKDQAFLVNAEI